MQYMHKGDKITVCGQGKLQEYDRKGGGKGYSLQLNVSDFTLPATPKKADDEEF